jgi:peptide deformylase
MKDEPGIEIVEEAYFNPEIIWHSSGKTTFKEGCLSIPEIYEDVLRPERIRVIYSNTDGASIEEELEGIKARIFQHEYDHLRGILFIDKINPLRRKVISGKLKKIKINKST